ncbi:MAG: hypothetical protein ABI321_14255 [Polyangia bacterium]
MPSRTFATLLLSLVVVSTTPAYAQKSEPVPPGASDGNDREVPSRPIPRTSDYQPGIADPSLVPQKAAPRFDPTDWKNAIAVYARYLFVTNLMLKPYLTAATELNSYAVGMQYIRRFDKFDVVTTLDFSWLALNSGNWLGKGNDPSVDTKYVQFDKLSFLSADVAIVGHHAFNNWLELRGGAGLGLGVVFGDVLTTSNSNQVCNKQTASHTSECYPIAPAPIGAIKIGQADTESKLKATQQSSQLDTAQNPHRSKATKPPVMAVVDIFIALNFRLHRNVSAQVEVGFRDAMFTGANFQYHF